MITKAIVIGMKCAEFHHNHSACAGKKGLGGAAPQQAKCKKCYLCPACYYTPGPFSGELGIRHLRKIISFRENFLAGKPSKTVISENQADSKTPTKPYAATLSEVFKT
jgi:hypothetical protein